MFRRIFNYLSGRTAIDFGSEASEQSTGQEAWLAVITLDSKSGGGANNEAALVVITTFRAPSNAKINARAWAENYV
jgi:hypothetical protein